MYQTTETITVLNRKYNNSTGRDEWIPTVISGVSWHSKIAATVTQTGLKTAKTATVRIPLDASAGGKGYVTPAAFKLLADTSGAYTLNRGDVIARGDYMPKPSESLTPAALQEVAEDCVTITDVIDNTRRPHGAHRRVVGT